MNYRHSFMICVAWLALAANAPADVIWSGEQNLSGYYQYIDLNADSLTDVTLVYNIFGSSFNNDEGYDGHLYAYVDGFDIVGSNRILVDSSNGYDAALPSGTLISASPASSLEWGSGWFFSGVVSDWATYPPDPDEAWRGLLGENGNTYIGIEFGVEDSTHYGWVNIALGPEEGPEGFKMPITTSWAYESTPGAGIVAGAIPEPSTGVLALVGAAALLLARRRFR